MARALRILLPGFPSEVLSDFDTGEDPVVWNGDALDLEFWLGSQCGSDDPFDVSDIDTLTLQIRATPSSTSLLFAAMELDGSELEECTASDWRSGDSQHGTFEFADGDILFDSDLTKAWFSFRAALVSGGSRTFGAGYVKILTSVDGGPVAADGVLRVEDATLALGASSFLVTLAAGESIVAVLSQAGTNPVQVQGVSYSGTTATVYFTGTALAATAFKVSIQLSDLTEDDSLRIEDATLASGDDELVITIAAGESILSVLAQSGTNPLQVQGVTYSGSGNTTATISFTGAAAADTTFKITIQRP